MLGMLLDADGHSVTVVHVPKQGCKARRDCTPACAFSTSGSLPARDNIAALPMFMHQTRQSVQ